MLSPLLMLSFNTRQKITSSRQIIWNWLGFAVFLGLSTCRNWQWRPRSPAKLYQVFPSHVRESNTTNCLFALLFVLCRNLIQTDCSVLITSEHEESLAYLDNTIRLPGNDPFRVHSHLRFIRCELKILVMDCVPIFSKYLLTGKFA